MLGKNRYSYFYHYTEIIIRKEKYEPQFVVSVRTIHFWREAGALIHTLFYFRNRLLVYLKFLSAIFLSEPFNLLRVLFDFFDIIGQSRFC